METPKFRVEVTDYSISVDEWRRAHSAAKGELPELDELQREYASKFGISEEKYARSVLAVRFGVQRLRNRATKLGEEVQKILVAVSARISSKQGRCGFGPRALGDCNPDP